MRMVVATMIIMNFGTPVFAGLEDAKESMNDAIKEVSLAVVLPKLAETLAVEEAVLQLALVEHKLKLSDVAMAKMVSEKNGKSVRDILKGGAPNWPVLLKENGLNEGDATEYLDALQSEVAFAVMDLKTARKK